MWKKVLYFGLAIVIGIMIYVIGYSSNQMSHLESLVKNAIDNEEFYKVPMVWDGCFDTKSIVANDNDKLDIVIYPATAETDISYGDTDNPERFLKYERAYYVYIFNAKFSFGTINTGSSSFNKTSISFSGDNSTEAYEYYFVVNEDINNSSYVQEPKTKEEYVLKNEREITASQASWNFMRITFTETMLDQITKELNGPITKLEVKDAEGVVQYSTAVQLDFSQAFFTDIKPLFDNYNVYLEKYVAADGDKTKLQEAADEFQEFYDPWSVEFENDKEQTGYTFRYDNSELSPSKLVWQTIGMLALYALVIVLFYILLFHFNAIRGLFNRENYKRYSKKSEVMVNGKLVSRSKEKMAKPVSTKSVDEVKPDVTADEALETITAGDVLDAPVEEAPAAEEAPVEEEKPIEEKASVEATPVVEQPIVLEETPAVVAEEPVKKPATKKAPAKKTSTSKTGAKKSSTKSKEKKDETN